MSQAPGTQIAERTPQQELVSQVRSEEFMQQVALALPETVPPRRFVRATITAVNQNPDLADPEKCNVGTVFTALLRAAQDGLLPDGREAAIAIYKGKAQYLPMIGGYRKIAGDHGWQIVARVVYEADEFEYEEGLKPKLRHVRARPGVDRGERIAAYATARHISGQVAAPVVMYADEIAKRQAKAQTQNVWNEWPDRMWEKTVGKALFKELPIGDLDPRVARVIAAGETNGDDAAAMLYGPRARRELPAPSTPAAEVGASADGTQGEGTESQDAGQQAGASAAAEAPAPDAFPGEPSTEEEPEQQSMFKAPAGVTQPEDAEAAKAAADAAGAEVISRGTHKGKTIEMVAALSRGPGWVKWAMETPDFPHCQAARTYARVFLPETYAEAMAALATKPQEQAA